MIKQTLRYALLATTASLGTVAAHAQSADAPEATGASGLEEIVVTARKREETLQNVPVAVSAVSGDDLRRNLASDMTKMAELAPQVSISQGGSGTGAVITVRGVSSASNDAGLDQSVAIELDNMPMSRGQIIAASLFDIQQVQILQGPQALFFGKNSPAGVISISSANPTDRFEGYLTAGYEFEAHQKYSEGAVSGPLTDALKARLAFRVSDMRGWIKNVATAQPDIVDPSITVPGANHRYNPGNRDIAVRGTLLWEPTSDFTANLKLTYNDQKRNAGNSTSEPFCLAPTTEPVLLGSVPLPGSDCKKNRVTSHGAVAPEYAENIPYANGGNPYFRSKIALATLTMTQRSDQGSFTSTTGYYNQVTKQLNVSDWATYATIWAASREKYKLFTQELRYDSDFDGPFNIMLGAYFEHFDRPLINTPDLFHEYNPQAGNFGSVTMVSKSKGDYISGFAQARWNILSNLELSGGARYSYDRKHLSLVNTEVGPSYVASLYPRGEVLRSRFSDSHVSPEATLTWHPQPDHTLYVAFKTGYKGGGISNGFLVPRSATGESLTFEPEKAEGFEAGYKATLFNRRLRFDLTGYTYKYSNLQVVSYNAETISFVLQNAATARIKGVQGSITWLPVDGLTLKGNFGYNDAKYINFSNAPCYVGQTAAQGCTGTPAAQDLSGKALLRAPKLTYSLGADYTTPLADGMDATLTVQGTHSSSFQTATDYAPGGFQKGYWLLNASASVSAGEGQYELALIGRNLTNTYYMLNVNGWSGSGNPNQYVGFFNRPREVVLQGTVKF
jgi:outer membrane receptor protein involved in Fe transport